MSAQPPPRPAGSARRAASRGHAVRWALGLGAGLMCAIGLVLLFLLTQATNNRALYERHFAWLLATNVLVAVVLLAVLLWGAVRLAMRLQRGRFGARLLIKLAGIFTVVGLVPGLLIYVVSYQFVSRSIESWFDVKVEGALSAGVNLGRVTLDTIAADMATKTRAASSQLAQVPDAAAGLVLERMRDQLGATDMVLWNANGQPVASAGQSRFQLSPERPAAQQLRALRQERISYQIEGLDEPGGSEEARVRVLVAAFTPGVGLLAEPRFVQATLPLPPALVANALAVQEANREYQERALARTGLRRMYIGTLTLSLFLAVFGAVLLAVVLGNQLVRPLLVLAEGVREVAAGNLAPKAALQGRDELGGLTRDFALMTRQLAEARATADRSMAALEAARGHLQTILDNLTAGVIVLDADGVVQSSNPGATRILRAPLAAYEGRPMAEAPGLAEFAQEVQRHFDRFALERGDHHGLDHWQHAFELHGSGEGLSQQGTNLVARGAELPDGLRLLVFDDISEIVSAQRAQAWGEVARRLAHEIKNPLTPIQLSAERLELKLDGKLPPAEQAVLSKSVRTIVDQVDAMKRLVNEFRDYARLPTAQLQPLDLNLLVQDVLQLYGAENASVPVRAELDPDCPPVAGDAQQLRQVVHNLLQNAQDATLQLARPAGEAPPPVRICTRWSEAAQRVRLLVIDHGPGFAPHVLQRAFEPYVTTKSRGTGLGLAVVKKIADEHGARIELSNRTTDGVVGGAQVSLSFAPVATPP
ncbi:sensor histidine kinase [Melaminivora alkalimesophila]|uniref:histidine kinase n=1 Tax=Melaminivora alkalimesophila TaxID=1165852 RepID=A0A317RCX0_9BURK|nr:ATP-binding protein [Melaminivora alkalimesophila]PWW44340.1 nitrogen fixation/metabolism regulation signal transduction histidine kinase [Melaminivora alkalimesophila]